MIALRIVNSQRFTEMHSRITESAFIEASHAQIAICDRRFRHTTRAFGFAPKRFRGLARASDFAAQ